MINLDVPALVRAVLVAVRDTPELRQIAVEIFGARSGEDDLVGAKGSGIGIKLFRRLVRSGELRASKVGKRFLVRRSDLDVWIGAHRVEPDAAPEVTPSNDAFDRALAAGARRRAR